MTQSSKVEAIIELLKGGSTLSQYCPEPLGDMVHTLTLELDEQEQQSLEAELGKFHRAEPPVNRLEDFQLCPYCDHNSATFDDDRRWVCDACGEDW
jgi:hypothetical protein